MTMLDRMRRHKNWLKWSLGLVVVTFIAFYATDFVNTPDLDRCRRRLARRGRR